MFNQKNKEMKTIIILLGLCALVILNGCSTDQTSINDFSFPDLSGEYVYTGYDLNGDTVSTGILEIKFDTIQISGSKYLSGNGLENGEGPIKGQIDEFDNISIDLSPDSLYRILVKGRFQQTIEGLITGERYGDSGTEISPVKVGTFKAERNEKLD